MSHFSVRKRDPIFCLRANEAVECVLVLPNLLALSGSRGGNLQLWDMVKRKKLNHINLGSRPIISLCMIEKHPVKLMCHVRNVKIAVLHCEKDSSGWRFIVSKEIKTDCYTFCAAKLLNSSCVILSSDDGRHLIKWNFEKDETVEFATEPKAKQTVSSESTNNISSNAVVTCYEFFLLKNSAKMCSYNEHIVVGYENGCISVYDCTTHECLLDRLKVFKDMINCITVDEDNGHVYIGSVIRTVRIFNLDEIFSNKKNDDLEERKLKTKIETSVNKLCEGASYPLDLKGIKKILISNRTNTLLILSWMNNKAFRVDTTTLEWTKQNYDDDTCRFIGNVYIINDPDLISFIRKLRKGNFDDTYLVVCGENGVISFWEIV